MDVERSDLTNWKNKPRISHRVVVNNQTLTIFETFAYTDMIASINLKDLLIENHESENDCITLTNKLDKRKYVVCTIDMY